jgi:CheY-like chemotaxis protein
MQDRQIKVMVVDDDRSIIEMFKDLFKDVIRGEVISTAGDGSEAVSKYATMKPWPDVVLMDERMPGMSGLDATKKILEMNSSARIVFISADWAVKQKAMNAGARCFIQKPFRIDEFRACLERALT